MRSTRFRIAAIIAGVAMLGVSATEAAHLKESPKKHKILYHLNELGVDKAKFVLGNIENHIRGVGGVGNIEAIELVVHGPALRTFLTASIDPGVKAALERLQNQGSRSAHAATP